MHLHLMHRLLKVSYKMRLAGPLLIWSVVPRYVPASIHWHPQFVIGLPVPSLPRCIHKPSSSSRPSRYVLCTSDNPEFCLSQRDGGLTARHSKQMPHRRCLLQRAKTEIRILIGVLRLRLLHVRIQITSPFKWQRRALGARRGSDPGHLQRLVSLSSHNIETFRDGKGANVERCSFSVGRLPPAGPSVKSTVLSTLYTKHLVPAGSASQSVKYGGRSQDSRVVDVSDLLYWPRTPGEFGIGGRRHRFHPPSGPAEVSVRGIALADSLPRLPTPLPHSQTKQLGCAGSTGRIAADKLFF
jgi:hypothetical protein